MVESPPLTSRPQINDPQGMDVEDTIGGSEIVELFFGY